MGAKHRDVRSGGGGSGSSNGSSDSDDSRERKRARKHRSESERRPSSSSRRDDKKKWSKKSSRKDDRRDGRRDRKRRHSDDDRDRERAPAVDYPGAMRVVRELLGEFPEIADDLLALLQMVDDGEVAVIGGIENRRVRSKLKELFPLLGLVKLREPKGAYAKSKSATGESLLEIFQRMLPGDSDDQEAGAQPTERSTQQDDADSEEKAAGPVGPTPPTAQSESGQRSAVIGPAMPPPGVLPETSHIEDDDDDDDVVGPALPGMKGFRLADERVEAEMARQAKALEQEQWDRARGIRKPDEAAGVAPLAREEWMTVMPDSSFLKESLGPTVKRQSGKPAAFRSKEPATVDKTWFDTPEERERAKRAKLDIQLLGYVREENTPAIGPSMPSAATAGPSTNESIMPSANPEADNNIRRQMEQLKQSRGPSLLEQHQRKVAEEAKARGGVASSKPTGWNRDRDLTVRRAMSGDDADRIINASKQINSKFTAPTISRQFL